MKNISYRWTSQEVNRLVKLRRQKLPYKEIAKKLNRSISSCETKMHDIRCGLVREWRENDTILSLRKAVWHFDIEIKNLKSYIWDLKQDLEKGKKETEDGSDIKETILYLKQDIKKYKEVQNKILQTIEKAGGVI